MLSLGTVKEDATIHFFLSTSGTGGVEENFSATPAQADFPVYKDGTVMTLAASTITITNLATGLYKVAIDLSNDADFTRGSDYWMLVDPDTETLAGVAVSGVPGHFRIESTAEQASRLFLEKIFGLGCTISTTSGNGPTQVNLTDIVDPQTTEVAGEVLALWRQADGTLWFGVVTGFSYPNATIVALRGGATFPTVAAGDLLWRVDHCVARNGSIAEIPSSVDLTGVADNTVAILSQNAIPPKNAIFTFSFTLYNSDGDEVPGIVPTVTRSIDGEAFSAAGGVVTEIGAGSYKFAATAADMNGNYIVFRINHASIQPLSVHIITQGGV